MIGHQVINGYKQSPLGLIPSDWEVKKLGDIGKIRMCKRIFNHETTDKGSIPFYKIGTFGKEPDAFISQELYEDYRKKFSFPKKGDILISAAGTIGRTVVYDGRPAYFQDSNIVWIDNKESLIINEYLYYVYQIVKYNTEGGTIQRLYNNILTNTKFPLPPLTEQKAIADILSLMDTAINKNNELISKKEQQKKWLMWQLLTGRKRLKGFEKSKWSKLKLGDAFEFLKSYSISRDGLTTENSEGAIYCVHYGDIHALYENEFLNFETQQGIPQIIDDSQKIDKKDYLKDGDIVMADASEDYEGVGEVVEVLNINSKIAVGGLHTIVLRGNHNFVATGFRGYLFSSESVRNTMRKMATGTSVYSVTKTTLTNLVFDIPESTKEQTAIAQVLQAADKEIQLLKDKTIKLREKKKGLMQQLLTGKKRLKTNIE